ncbi:MAG: sensor histidine kinase [Thermoleophilaceae bacterium]
MYKAVMAAAPETKPAGPNPRTPTGTGLALVLAGSLLVTGAIALVLAETEGDHQPIVLTVHALGIALPFALGIVGILRRRDYRFAWLLVGAGALWSLVTLAESSNGSLYSIGRVAVWLVEPVIVYLMLSFPFGRLISTTDRRLFAAAVAIVAILYLPTALVVQTYPEPAPWASCGTDCPSNAFAVGHSTPALVDDFVRPLRESLSILVFAGVALALVRRSRRSAPTIRVAVAPVTVVAVARAILLPAYFALRADGQTSGLGDVLGWAFVLSLPAVTVCLAIGLLDQRLFVASALEHLTGGLRPHASARELRTAMADALEDPDLRMFYWMPRVNGVPARWVDETGHPSETPRAPPGRAVTEVATAGRPVAAIDHDIELLRDPSLIQAATAYALTALENERLVGRLHDSLRELSESRARIVSVTDRERRRFERDLHDGAQQRLVALQIKLELVAEQVEALSPESAGAIRELESDVDATIDEVRAFARGIYPSLLAEQGLSEALRAMGRSAPVATIVDAARIGRYPPEIEATVYFACIEALQNVAKHAHGASGVSISVSENGTLRFEVRDDGEGFDAASVDHGAGLTNIRDRLDAVGGKLEVRSAPGAGTRIVGSIPTGHGL